MAAEYLKRMGERIAAAREAKGWSQTKLAREVEQLRRRDEPGAAHIEASSISRYERGKVEPTAEMKDYLAEALGVTVAHFLAPAPDKSKTPEPFAHGDGTGKLEQLDRIESKLNAVLEFLGSDPDEEARRRYTKAILLIPANARPHRP